MESLPKALPHFEHIKRYWDPRRKLPIAQVLPGEVYVSNHHELITTLLGSCIAVCMRDKINNIGGMNHFQLPKPANDKFESENTNFGIYSMELLINEIMKNGGKKKNFECAIFGGGNILKSITTHIGEKNIDFVTTFLHQESIPIISKDTGHNEAQKIYYHPLTGNAFSVIKDNSTLTEVNNKEAQYLKRINDDNSGIEFF